MCADPPGFYGAGWNKPQTQFENYLREQAAGERDLLIAGWDQEFAGYLTIKWESYYESFRNKNIPVIMDLNVLVKFRNKVIAAGLMDEAGKGWERGLILPESVLV